MDPMGGPVYIVSHATTAPVGAAGPTALHHPSGPPLVPMPVVYPTASPQRSPVLPVSYGPPNPLFGGMEAVWHTEFQKFFSQFYGSYSHVWFLCPSSGRASARWITFLDSAKVRFCCQDCGHGWTSMKGRVAFWFSLINPSNEGFLTFKLYGQQCQRCKTGKYENAMWYPEEVSKVMHNAFYRVGQVYYGFCQASYSKNRRAGKPRTPHNSELCQACHDGVCSERK